MSRGERLAREFVESITVADPLGDAWAAAEAALPEGGEIWLRTDALAHPEHRYTAEASPVVMTEFSWHWVAGPFQAQYADGPTPAAALRALAEKLAEV